MADNHEMKPRDWNEAAQRLIDRGDLRQYRNEKAERQHRERSSLLLLHDAPGVCVGSDLWDRIRGMAVGEVET